MYRFVLWLVPTVEKFPRRQRFLLGDRLQATARDVLERLVEATYTRDRRRHLDAANLGIEKLRFLFRLAQDLGQPRPSPLRARGTHARRDRSARRRLAEGRMRRRRADGPAAFLANWRPRSCASKRELRAETWRPGGYVSFAKCGTRSAG